MHTKAEYYRQIQDKLKREDIQTNKKKIEKSFNQKIFSILYHAVLVYVEEGGR